MTRGIRANIERYLPQLGDATLARAQLGLGHAYSRSKVKFNVNRVDNMIIQSIALVDQLDKDINTFAMRAREWYSYAFPELIRIVPDNIEYVPCGDPRVYSHCRMQGTSRFFPLPGSFTSSLHAVRAVRASDWRQGVAQGRRRRKGGARPSARRRRGALPVVVFGTSMTRCRRRRLGARR